MVIFKALYQLFVFGILWVIIGQFKWGTETIESQFHRWINSRPVQHQIVGFKNHPAWNQISNSSLKLVADAKSIVGGWLPIGQDQINRPIIQKIIASPKIGQIAIANTLKEIEGTGFSKTSKAQEIISATDQQKLIEVLEQTRRH